MHGYPVGTVCVVTWAPNAVLHKIGMMVRVTSEPFVFIPGEWAAGVQMKSTREDLRGLVCQRTDVCPNALCPVAWLRPLSDPDEEENAEISSLHSTRQDAGLADER